MVYLRPLTSRPSFSTLFAFCLVLTLSAAPFAGPPPLETSSFWGTSETNVTTTGMIWRDCNRDGYIDVFFANGNDITQSPNMIYLSDHGTMPGAASWFSTNEEYSGHCAVGDIDDDGYPDFIVANYLGINWDYANLSDLYYNDGPLPSIAPDWYTPDSIYSFSNALGDVDGDGDLDIAFATGEGYNGIYSRDVIYFNEGGSFSSTPGWQSSSATTGMDVTFGDVDNDGDLDMAFTYSSGRATSVYYNNNGTLETTPSWQASTSESGNTLIFGDVNGDGWLDLIVAYNDQTGGNGLFAVYFNDGTGTLDSDFGWQSADGGYGAALALYDYDDDGDQDLAAGRWFHRILVYENTGSTFTSTPVWMSNVSHVAEELAWVDVTGHGVQSFVDTIAGDGSRKLFYTERTPLYEIDSVYVGGALLDYEDYCFDLISGWVSLGEAPSTDIQIFYRFSYWADLAISDWGSDNAAYANTDKPFIDFSADIVLGPAPHSVGFTDLSTDATVWDWDFGDGGISSDQDPTHDFLTPGSYTVSMTADLPAGEFTRSRKDMIAVYADTMTVLNTIGVAESTLQIDVYARNYLPLDEIMIPFTWAGPMGIEYDSFSTAGLRTEYFEQQTQANYDYFGHKAAVGLVASNSGSQPPLEPGDGPIVSLFFTMPISPGADQDSVRIISYNQFAPQFVTYAGEYEPVTNNGLVSLNCCQGPSVGNVDNSADMLVTMGDLTVLIDHLFISLTPLTCVAEGNVDMSVDGLVTMGDLTVLIDALFISLNPLPPCP